MAAWVRPRPDVQAIRVPVSLRRACPISGPNWFRTPSRSVWSWARADDPRAHLSGIDT